MVTGTMADALSEPEVPVMVKLYSPKLALLVAVSVRVLPLLVGLGEKDAVTPLGRPEAASRTFPENPF